MGDPAELTQRRGERGESQEQERGQPCPRSARGYELADKAVRAPVVKLNCSTMLPLRQIREISMQRINGAEMRDDKDLLAAEEPLEIRVEGRSVAVVMRTPGNDHELAAGFLASEGLVHAAGDIREISYEEHCRLPTRVKRPPAESAANQSAGNVIQVRLKNPAGLDVAKLTRNVFTSSSCGICSKASIEAVRQNFPRIEDNCKVEPRVLMDLPRTLGLAQQTFKQTGGLHACALFDLNGKLIVLHEDVGRHNALDKVVGWASNT